MSPDCFQGYKEYPLISEDLNTAVTMANSTRDVPDYSDIQKATSLLHSADFKSLLFGWFNMSGLTRTSGQKATATRQKTAKEKGKHEAKQAIPGCSVHTN